MAPQLAATAATATVGRRVAEAGLIRWVAQGECRRQRTWRKVALVVVATRARCQTQTDCPSLGGEHEEAAEGCSGR